MKTKENEPWSQKPFFVPDKFKRICIKRPGYKPVEWKFPLEKLPPVLLDEVFQYVQSHDLAKLAGLSKSLYWPAVHRIYRTITFFDGGYPYDEPIYNTTVCRKRWKLNYGTACKVTYVKSLYDVVGKNVQLAKLVQELTYIGEYGAGPMSKLLNSLPNLRSFKDNGGFLRPEELTRQLALTSLSVSAGIFPRLSSSLVELRIVSYDLDENAEDFHKFGCYLIQSHNYEHLRKLDFHDYNLDTNYHKRLRPYSPQDVRPDWQSFLAPFATEGVTLNLTSLGLGGHFPGKVGKAVSLLRKCIKLENLKCLMLNHSESNSSYEELIENTLQEDEGVYMLFGEITKYTPSLERLSINPVAIDCPCSIEDICPILEENIPHQLKELSIEYFPRDDSEVEDLMELKRAIVSSQKNLVKLRIENGLSLLPETDESIIEELVTISRNMAIDWSTQVHRSELFPRLFELFQNRPYVSEKSAEYIKNNISVVHKGLLEDPIYEGSPNLLPFLAEYYTGGIFFDMKKRGVFVNDETLVFVEEEQEARKGDIVNQEVGVECSGDD